MDKIKITRVEATSTGGNIYVYTGKLSDGRFFFCADDWEDFVYIMDTDPNEDWENNGYLEWQEAHTVEMLTEKSSYDFWKTMLQTVEMSDILKDIRLKCLDEDYPQYAD